MTVDSAHFVLSPVQERLWRLQAGPRLVVRSRLALRGPRLAAPPVSQLAARVEAALTALVARHEALRTVFPPLSGMDLPAQAVVDEALLDFAVRDLSALPEAARRQALEEAWTALGADASTDAAAFDLVAGPMLRARLFVGADGEGVLLLATPALVADPASHRVLAAELARRLAGDDAAADDDEVVQSIDASEWQREILASDEGRDGRQHWHRRLATARFDDTAWPAATPPTAATAAAQRAEGRLDAAATGRLRRFAAAALEDAEAGGNEITGAAPLLAAWLLLLRRHQSADEVTVGTFHEGRKYEALEGLVGAFSRHLPSPFAVAPERPFADLVREAAASLAQADEWEEYFAWGEVARALELPQPPVVPYLFAATAAPPRLRAGDVEVEMERLEGTVEPFHLKLTVGQGSDALSWCVEAPDGRLPDGEAERLSARLATLLEALTGPHGEAAWRRAIGDLPLLPAAELEHLHRLAGGGDAPSPTATDVQTAFAAAAARTPDAVALVDGDLHLSFAALERRAALLAGRFRALGVGLQDWVLLPLPRGAAQLTAALATLRAGAVLVPVDAEQPALRSERLAAEAIRAAGATGSRRTWWVEAAGVPVPAALAERTLPAAAEASGDEAGTAVADAVADAVAVDGDALAYVLFTSGSTGRPKGVMVRQRSVLTLAAALEERIYRRLGEGGSAVRRVGLNAPLFFDASVKQWVQWLHGRAVEVVPEAARRDGAALDAFLAERRPPLVDCTPSQLQLLLAAAQPAGATAPATALLLGGEALTPALWQLLAGGGFDAYNVYGPTETTVDVTAVPVAGSAPVLGRPLAGWGVHLLDRRLQPVPPGVIGEMAIAGAGLARGYAGRAARTAAAFVPAPFAVAGERLYLSGDLARLRPDGALEFVGRRDHQVKLRGFRVELEEIAAALGEHPAVAEAVALVVPRPESGDERLVAYLSLRRDAEATAAELAEHLGQRLPAHAVPATFVVLDRLPLTRNGKVDRAALPSPEEAETLQAGDLTAPRTPFEEMLAAVWREVLGVERVGVDQSFFDLGGHSLLATQLIARVRQVFQVELPLRYLFEEPTVRQLARRLAERLQSGGGEPLPAVEPRSGGGAAPASFGQQRLWFLDRLEPGSAAYNMASSVPVEGDLDAAALARALHRLGRRHEVLRTTLRPADGDDEDGVPRQHVAAEPRLPLLQVDLTALPQARRGDELRRRTAVEALRPFDLATGPLLRAFLFLAAGGSPTTLLTVLHHAVSDAWSSGVLLRDMAAFYRAESAAEAEEAEALPELPVQYADYAAWQRRHLTREALAEPLAWWRQRLGGELPVLALPTDRPRSATPTFRGAVRDLALPAELEAGLRELARRRGVTPFMTLLAVFAVLLRRCSGQREMLLGVPVANRDRLEIENLIGFFVNTVALRLELPPGVTGDALLAAVREEALGAFARQEVPFEMLVEEVNPGRDLAASPLFQVVYMHENTPRQPLRLPGLTFGRPRNEGRTSAFDLSLMTREAETGLTCHLEYPTDLFDAATAERLLRGYRSLLAGLVADPEAAVLDLPLLAAAERHQVAVEWNDSGRAFAADLRLHDLVARRAAAAPDAVAVAADGGHLSYAELLRRARRLARRLAAAGVGPEVPVGIFLDRVPELAVAHLAVLAAGGACLPLDPGLPAERVAFLLADSAAPLVLTRGALTSLLPASVDAVDLDAAAWMEAEAESTAPDPDRADPDCADPVNAAYVIYTSGSTGRPKGVSVPHRALVGYALDMARRFTLTPRDRVLQFAALSFDVVLEELFPAWAAGAAVVLAPAAELADPAAFSALAVRRQVTCCELPAAYWQDWTEALDAAGEAPAACLRLLILGSEKPSPDTVAAWHRHGVDTIYIFGLTETAVTSCLLPLSSPLAAERGWDLPIGRPTDNAGLYVLDEAGRPAPAGVPGELYVGGAGVSRGYLGRPALTAARFVPDPFAAAGAEPQAAGARLYRTGDRARWLPSGAVDFLGRTDHQINLRGLRIEPGEVEALLESQPAVRRAVVGVRTTPAGGRALVAWLVGDDATAADAAAAPAPPALVAELRRALRSRLPEGMVPARFVLLPALPTTPHGKVDRRALPDPAWGDDGGDGDDGATAGSAAPATPVEELLAGLWSDLLEVDAVGPQSDFFALGGHSLLATRLLARVRASLGVEPPLRRLFEEPTLAAFARVVEEERRRGGRFVPPPFAVAPADGEPQDAEPAASFAQRRLWLHHRLQPESVAYNMPSALRLRGELRPAVLIDTLSEVVRRHRVLRTSFGDHPSEPRPRWAPPAPVPVPLVDLSHLGAAAETAALELARGEAVRPFDLDRGPLLRARLLRFAADHHLLLLSIHHVAFDAWSGNLLLGEVQGLYAAFAAGRPSPLAELPAQYDDYARWQSGWLRGEVLDGYLEHWRQRLEDLPGSPLPADRPRGDGAGERGANLFFRLPEELAAPLRELSRRRGVTLFMTLLAAFDVLLWHASGGRSEDVVVGTDVAHRTVAESEGMIGFFVNQLVLRSDLSGDPTFGELLQRVRAVTLDAYEHQDVPFDELVRALRPRRQLDRHPLFQVKLVLQNAAGGELRVGGDGVPPLSGEGLRFDRGIAKFDLLVDLEDHGGDLEARAEYNKELFDDATVEELMARWRWLLARVAEEPQARLGELAAQLDAARAAARREERRDEETRLAATSLSKLRRRRGPAVQAAADAAATKAGEVDE